MQNSKVHKNHIGLFVAIFATVGWVVCAQQHWRIPAYLLFVVWAIRYFAEFPQHVKEAIQEKQCKQVRTVLWDCLTATLWFCVLQLWLNF